METFDTKQAESRHAELMRRLDKLEYELVKDVIKHNRDRVPKSAAEEREQYNDMYKYLKIASERIDDLLKELD